MPKTLRTMRLPEKEPRLSLNNMKPAVEVKKAMMVQASEEWMTLSHSTDCVDAVVSTTLNSRQPSATAKMALNSVAVHNNDENIAASAFSRISCITRFTVDSMPAPLLKM